MNKNNLTPPLFVESPKSERPAYCWRPVTLRIEHIESVQELGPQLFLIRMASGQQYETSSCPVMPSGWFHTQTRYNASGIVLMKNSSPHTTEDLIAIPRPKRVRFWPFLKHLLTHLPDIK